MRNYNINHQVKGSSFDPKWNDQHTIIVDHPFFSDMGIGNFSLSEYYDWVFETNVEDKRLTLNEVEGLLPNYIYSRYPNTKLYVHNKNIIKFGNKNPVDTILGQGQTKELSFTVWRNSGRNGSYAETNIKDWYLQVGDNSYSYNDLDINFFDGKVFNGDLVTLEDNPYPIEFKELENIIQMNNWVNFLELKKDVSTFDKKERARYEFITDIRASKDGALNWSDTIEFVLQLPVKSYRGINGNEISDSCIKEAEISYKLHLYGNSNRKNTERVISIQNPIIAQMRQNPVGQSYVREDEAGATVEYSTNNPKPSNAVAAPIRMSYSELEGKWESGTQQIFAILQTDIESAEYPDDFILSDENDLLDPTTGFGIKTGIALPVMMKNKNPKQWMPNFLLTKEQRAKETDETIKNQKALLTVYNPFNRAFGSGDAVILQKIQGVWMPLSPGEGEPSIVPIEPADPNWEFMYLVTNGMHYFKTKDREATIDPLTYEKAYYECFYYDDEEPADNATPIIEVSDPSKGNKNRYSSAFPVEGKTFDQYIETTNGYMQITSWDYMGRHFGGTKEGWANSLSATRFGVAANNQPFDNDGYDGKLNTYPFFGCVFADGYNGSKTFSEVEDKDRDFSLYANNFYPNDSGVGTNVETFYKFFHTVGKQGESTPPENPPSPFSDIERVRGNFSLLNGERKDGMFNAEEGNFWNLPADIATNCSPRGKWGWPISNIQYWQQLLEQGRNDYATKFRENTLKYFENREDGRPARYSWVSKREMTTPMESGGVYDDTKTSYYSTSGESEKYTPHDNVFDIQPNNFLKIEFRPMTQELYSQWELSEIRDDQFGSSWDDERSPIPKYDDEDLGYALLPAERGEYAYRLYQAVGFGKGNNKDPVGGDNLGGPAEAISNEALQRNWPVIDGDLLSENSLISTQGEVSDTEKINHNGLKYNVDIVDYENNGIPKDGGGDFDYTESNPLRWWNELWHNPNDGTGGAGATSVIGAVVTLSTRSIININTENALGVDGYLEFFSLIEGNQFGCSLRNGDYKDLATSNMYARIYTHHPRELTVYDPRFFVVHHFNSGVHIEREAVAFEWASGGTVYTNEEIAAGTGEGGDFYQNDPINGSFNDGVPYRYNDGWYRVAKRGSEVDLRVPTTQTGEFGDKYTGLPIETGVKVYGDGVTDKDGDKGDIRVNKTEWLLNTQRRGKLLPYSFNYSTLAVAPTGEALIATTISENQNAVAVKDIPEKIMITNGGSGYNNGDLFSIRGGRRGFLLEAVVDQEGGAITNFTVKTPGSAFLVEDFLPSDRVIEWVDGGEAPTGNEQIIPYPDADPPVEGTGLTAWLLSGEVIKSAILTDFKPQLALGSREIKVTPNIPRCNSDNLTPQQQGTNNLNLEIVNFALDNKYDVFLHYHNDISHTRIDDGGNVPPAAVDQMVRISFVTNDDGNAGGTAGSPDFADGGGLGAGFDGDGFSIGANIGAGIGGAFWDDNGNQGDTLGNGGGGGFAFR